MNKPLNKNIVLSVSSVLNRDTKQYGKQFMIDGRDDTCWNSDQGDSQWININLDQSVVLSKIKIQFQGGFSSKHVLMQLINDNKTVLEHDIYPEDNNSLQEFSNLPCCQINQIKLFFRENVDFFGRIIIYKLELIPES